jgi:hypothetical protein
MTHGFDDVRCVADGELLARLERLVKADRAISVKLLVHLGEVEARKLYLERGYSSMYSYCMTALGLSEAETYLRLLAAKTGKRLPLVLERLADGGLHLTAIKLLAPLLTEENHVALLDRARGMSKRQLEVLVAELAPQPDVPERMRKLPESRGPSAVAAQRSFSEQARGEGNSQTRAATVEGGAAVHVAVADGCCDSLAVKAADSGYAPHAGGAPAARASISPLRPGRFKLELTLGQEAHDQLEQLRELLRHQYPSGEITRIIERALRELLERTLKRRFAQTGSSRRQGARPQDGVAGSKASSADADELQPNCSAEAHALDAAHGGGASRGAAVVLVLVRGGSARSRYVPRDVLREIYARDTGQCSFVSADGRRCSARGFLEVHHHEAFARGGAATVDNLRLACRAHNFWLAERELGPAFMRGKLLHAQSRLFAARLAGV